MGRTSSKVPPMKDLAVISDPKVVRVLMEPTRAQILFKYLVNGPMTVKQLADALGKNPGTILHHIEKLKKAGLVVQDRTEQTITGIVQRYYRATAREFRMGLGGLLQRNNGIAKFAEGRLQSIIRALAVYGFDIGEEDLERGIGLLRNLIERENEVSSNIRILDADLYNTLPESVRADASRIVRRFSLEEDSKFKSLRKKWHEFLKMHKRGEME